MRIITEQELKDILDKHNQWLENEPNGVRADLRYANLSGANLSDANLSDANLSDANLRYANLSDANLSGANLSDANLRYANLSDANLRYANLSGANLSGANLSGANLSDANLSGANLSDANLSDANLSDANLRYANLSDANLSDANLSGANLSGANLRYANLRYANLSDANLESIKKDFIDKLTLAKNEAIGLYDYIQKGLVDGTSYEGECACFVGTVAKVAKEHYEKLSCGIVPNSSSPIEIFFFNIRKGDIPANNQASRIVAGWIEEFAVEHSIQLPKYKIVSNLEAPDCFS